MAVKTAIVGLGIMGRRMIEHMVRHEGYEPVARWDPCPNSYAQAMPLAPDAVIATSADAAISTADLV